MTPPSSPPTSPLIKVGFRHSIKKERKLLGLHEIFTSYAVALSRHAGEYARYKQIIKKHLSSHVRVLSRFKDPGFQWSPISIAGLPFDSCQELKGRLVTAHPLALVCVPKFFERV